MTIQKQYNKLQKTTNVIKQKDLCVKLLDNIISNNLTESTEHFKAIKRSLENNRISVQDLLDDKDFFDLYVQKAIGLEQKFQQLRCNIIAINPDAPPALPPRKVTLEQKINSLLNKNISDQDLPKAKNTCIEIIDEIIIQQKKQPINKGFNNVSRWEEMKKNLLNDQNTSLSIKYITHYVLLANQYNTTKTHSLN